jgi:endonuclease/exonuclease/phosphatase family metal-dependent hydrolase
MRLTVTTFNLENLFNRYAFLDMPWEERNYEKIVQAIGLVSVASRAGDLVSYATTEIQRNNTARALLDSEPDVLAVQEVENLYTLRLFNEEYLDNYFDRMLLIDGNDPRGIDVGFLVRRGFPGQIRNVRTHVDEAVPGAAIARSSVRNFGYLVRGALFSRDCLEVDLELGNRIITFLVNHFKAQDGTQDAVRRRKRQASRVAELALEAVQEGRLPVVLGDLNAPPDADGSLDALLNSPVLQDPFPADTWTHYYVPAKQVSRLDYILPHKKLKVEDVNIVRKGLTTKCKQYQGERYPTVGPAHTEASDHCPVSVRLKVS